MRMRKPIPMHNLFPANVTVGFNFKFILEVLFNLFWLGILIFSLKSGLPV